MQPAQLVMTSHGNYILQSNDVQYVPVQRVDLTHNAVSTEPRMFLSAISPQIKPIPAPPTTIPTYKLALNSSMELIPALFGYCLNNILYQRGVYSELAFSPVIKHGLHLVVTNDADLQTYMRHVMNQLQEWTKRNFLPKLVIAIKTNRGHVFEYWNIEFLLRNRLEAEYELQQAIKQMVLSVTAACSRLPLLPEHCTFDLEVFEA